VCLGCREAILERCLGRLEWEKVKETEARAEAEAKEAERLAMQSIDWCARRDRLPPVCRQHSC